MPVRPFPALVTSALALALTALPLAGTASARPASSSCSARAIEAAEADGPDVAALCAALKGLPDRDATAALIRVGGHGSWHGEAGVRDIRSGAPARADARYRAGDTKKIVTSAFVLQLAAEGRI
jgi:D-alanyl-D-alanine carboxypeptidase